ncbi:MAG: dihydropteroate synthase [Candidatus Peribacteraceae bacterium]|nr:dihydropteroate synthase [Candidatus Peribacteraceae bacterium]
MSFLLRSGLKTLDYTGKTLVVGILNITPDSFVDGGKWLEPHKAIDRATEMIAQGADIIDIGGESTGPDSLSVSAEEEIRRVLPIIKALRSELSDVWLSIDTWKADVADNALQSGVDMINDISAGRFDPQMFSVLAKHQCPYVLMYSKDTTPRTKKIDQQYDNVIETIHAFLADRIHQAIEQGIDRSRIIVDPGLGWFVSGTPSYSFEILNQLEKFADLAPVFISPSRKSFLAGPNNLPASERLSATLDATKIALEHGASFIRTHDVSETKNVIHRFFFNHRDESRITNHEL